MYKVTPLQHKNALLAHNVAFVEVSLIAKYTTDYTSAAKQHAFRIVRLLKNNINIETCGVSRLVVGVALLPGCRCSARSILDIEV